MVQHQNDRPHSKPGQIKRRWARFRAFQVAAPVKFATQIEPRAIGLFAQGRHLIAGKFLFEGQLIEGQDISIWDAAEMSEHGQEIAQGFTWLDDLVAVGDQRARQKAQAWLIEWIDRFGHGQGDAWDPVLIGRRLIRWLTHSGFIRRGLSEDDRARHLRFAAIQTAYLSRVWRQSATGSDRIEALTGLLYGTLAFERNAHRVDKVLQALAEACDDWIDTDGAIPSRNPEALLGDFTHLVWVKLALSSVGIPCPDQIEATIRRTSPTLRALRHGDGSLARFHGGGRGLEGWLDHALALSETPHTLRIGRAMGFGRLAAGRTTVLIDADLPPAGEFSRTAHASTLGIEVTSGRRPIIVNCGSGRSFGADWRRAVRATPSHSALLLDGMSTSRIVSGRDGASECLADIPTEVRFDTDGPEGYVTLAASHDSYRTTHGLTHARTLHLSKDGRVLSGEDLLTIVTEDDKHAFDAARMRQMNAGIPWRAHFHLHPSVAAEQEDGRIFMLLPSGERWYFTTDEGCAITLEPSIYLEYGRLGVRATQQVVLSGRTMSYSTRINWALEKANTSSTAIRDWTIADNGPETESEDQPSKG